MPASEASLGSPSNFCRSGAWFLGVASLLFHSKRQRTEPSCILVHTSHSSLSQDRVKSVSKPVQLLRVASLSLSLSLSCPPALPPSLFPVLFYPQFHLRQELYQTQEPLAPCFIHYSSLLASVLSCIAPATCAALLSAS